MLDKEITAIQHWKIDYPNDYIAGEKVKFRATSTAAKPPDVLALLTDLYATKVEFEEQEIPPAMPITATDWFVKGLKGRPFEILLENFSPESWEITRSARWRLRKTAVEEIDALPDAVVGWWLGSSAGGLSPLARGMAKAALKSGVVTTEEEKLICELIVTWTDKRWFAFPAELTGKLLQYQDVLVFGGFLNGEANATRKLNEETLSAHREFVEEGLNKKLGLSEEKVKEIQEAVGATQTGRYGLETVLKVIGHQRWLKQAGFYDGKEDGFWNPEVERYTFGPHTEVLGEGRVAVGLPPRDISTSSGAIVGDYLAVIPDDIRGELSYEGWVWLVHEVSRQGATPEQFGEIVINLSREWRYTEKWEEWQREVEEFAAAHPEIKPFIETFKEERFWFELKSFLAMVTMPVPFAGGTTAVGLVEGEVKPWEVIPGYSVVNFVVKVVEYAEGKTSGDEVINSLIDVAADAAMIIIFRGSKPKQKQRLVSRKARPQKAHPDWSKGLHGKEDIGVHGKTIVDTANKMAERWKYAKIYVNKTLTRATEGKVVSKWRIDIVAETRMGKYDVIEVINTQSEKEAREKLKEVINLLGKFAGKSEVIQAK
jgi:hypothetical protein